MLKCKHCEGEIVAEIMVRVPLNFKVDKYGKYDEISKGKYIIPTKYLTLKH